MLHYLFKKQFMELIGLKSISDKFTSCLSADPTLVNIQMEAIQSDLLKNPKQIAFDQMKLKHKAEN